MKSRRVSIWVVVGLLVLVAGSAFFVSRLERTKKTVSFGPNAEARANPRLAALELLERFGLKTRTLRDPEILPAKGAMVLLPADVYLDPSRIARWRRWVEEGGILMAGLDADQEVRTRLLAGITGVIEYKPAQHDEDAEEDEVGAGEAGASGEELAEKAQEKPAAEGVSAQGAEVGGEAAPVDPEAAADTETAPATDEIGAADSDDYYTFDPLSGEQTEVRLALRPKWVMPRHDFDRCRSGYYLEEGGVVAIFALGEGFLVLLADDTIFDNGRIAGADHALFLWQLVKYFGDPPEVVALLGDRIGFLAFLWRAAWPLLVALLLLTLIFIWERAPRFGPPVELRPSGQRGLRAHLKAAAAFQWRHHDQAALLEPLRAEVLRRARVSIPGWPGFAPERQKAELARIARLPEPAIAAALGDVPDNDPQEFTTLVATLETLRKAL